MNRESLNSLSILELLENKNRLLLAVEELDYLCEDLKTEQFELSATNEMLKAAVVQLAPPEPTFVERVKTSIGGLWNSIRRDKQAGELRELLFEKPTEAADHVAVEMFWSSSSTLASESQEPSIIESRPETEARLRRWDPPKLSDLPALLNFNVEAQALEAKPEEEGMRQSKKHSQPRGAEGRTSKKKPSQRTKAYKIDL
mmetsp:Transcript_1651/g.3555  ORF Transcript_1651/g.3555 Transcript_1651/m.3555 type:complete len:200 (+) Transcript_1651:4619-5218(+)